MFHDAANLCIVHDEEGLVIRTVINHFVQSDNVWMSQHLVDVHLSHCVQIGCPIILAHDSPSELLHDELLEGTIRLAEGNAAVLGIRNRVK